MAEISIRLPSELKEKASSLSEESLAKLFEKALRSDLERREREEALSKLKDLFKNSKLTDEDCLSLGEKVKKDLFKRLQKKGKL